MVHLIDTTNCEHYNCLQIFINTINNVSKKDYLWNQWYTHMVRALWCIVVALHCMMKINAVYLHCIPNLAPIYEMHCIMHCANFISKFVLPAVKTSELVRLNHHISFHFKLLFFVYLGLTSEISIELKNSSHRKL